MLDVMIVVKSDWTDLRIRQLIRTILEATETVRIVVITGEDDSLNLGEFRFLLFALKPIDSARMFFDAAQAPFNGQVCNLYD